ncbi:uncharacterized protein BDZ99DRAFT_513951 [Mytilinidion resinicola]|uniref:Uncharacterized protein n=1 Tax=Mytilinidion resinicola TaxID=574789 RepID=A0A6A6ZBX8_9PEZI|nr:uncharacterized protein BDZ99DRAFT_513951 [Mytilinidion resinicola]KAF2817727.1 hypothetical protein BDZ99DRAFT_513951 [Mytilinidion resinicola]
MPAQGVPPVQIESSCDDQFGIRHATMLRDATSSTNVMITRDGVANLEPLRRQYDRRVSADKFLNSPVKINGSEDCDTRTEHLKQHLRCAKEILSVASDYVGSDASTVLDNYSESNSSTYHGSLFSQHSSIYSQSEGIDALTQAFGSVVGLDETRRRSIHCWIPGTVTEEDAAQPLEQEDDFEKLLYQIRYRKAEEALRDKRYSEAESLLTKCITGKHAMDS